jgi:hypothetical protein
VGVLVVLDKVETTVQVVAVVVVGNYKRLSI